MASSVGLFFSSLSMEIVENLFLRQSPLSKERAGGEAIGLGRGPFCQNPAAVFINTTAVAVISDAVFANAKNVCDREKICFCRK